MSVSEPGKIITPWAESGLKNPIPPAANPATGRAGFDQGFSAINMTAKEAGGIPPFGQDFNGIFYEVTNILRYMQAGGQPTFDAAMATAIGGYPKGAMVLGDDGISVYTNRINSNSANPNLGGGGWANSSLMLREALRRSYAEAGYNLVDGSFEVGGTVTTFTDVLLLEADGKAYSYKGVLPHTVYNGATPSSEPEMWVDQSDVSPTEIAVITPFLTTAPTHKDAFQNAINSGSVWIPAGVSLNISGDITIPANRLIIVDFGATITSNGRFTAYGVNNVHWRVSGKLLSVGMTDAPAKSGWPNTGEGTQNGNERAFIEFGGVIFGGNDGVDYSFHLSNTGVLAGDWVGTPNASDIPRIVNRKGVAAWNCSNVDFVLDGEVYGFEGEAVYWCSGSSDAKNVYMRAKNLHDCRFNGVNVNARNAFENIKIEDSNTKNTYQGVESSAGDVVNCTDYGSFKAVYAGQGAGGKSRKISGNKSYDCKGVPFSIVYNRNFEGSGRVRNVVITDNHAFDPADGFMAAADIDGLQMHGNTCTRLKAGRFLQVTGCVDGAVTGNLNVSPAAGTEHIYRAENTAVAFSGNDKSFIGNDYTALDKKSNGFIGGKSSSVMTHGNRENFQDLYCQPDLTGVGGEYRYSYGDAIGFIGATTCTALTQLDGSGATAEWRVNNLKYNTGDVLGTSLRITNQGHALPGTNGTQNLGSAVLPWNQVFAAVGTIQPSDRRIKEQIEDIPDLALDAYGSVAHKRFKYIAAVNEKMEKGEEARWHTGLIAQDIKEAFEAVGLDATEYGLLCYNSWPDIYEPVFEEVEEDGKLVMKDTGNTRLVMAAGDRWSIRPDECTFMEAAYQRRELARLKEMLKSK